MNEFLVLVVIHIVSSGAPLGMFYAWKQISPWPVDFIKNLKEQRKLEIPGIGSEPDWVFLGGGIVLASTI